MAIVAFDHDGTIDLIPQLMYRFMESLLEADHVVIIVTGRDGGLEPWIPVPVVYAGDAYKKDAAIKAGYVVDIWIDDQPGHIEPSRKLEWDT
jgi:hypothetical protein